MDSRRNNLLFHSAFVFIFILIRLQCSGALVIDNNPYRHFERLDPNGKFDLEWLVDLENERIYFNISAETRGYVGFGLSRKGKMSGADIVIGGIDSDGLPYFADRFAIDNNLPEIDESQDWVLHSVRESETHTFLSFSRDLVSCDTEHDLPIDNNLISLLWAYGDKDDGLEYHHQNRGTFETYLLDPDLTPGIVESGKATRRDPLALGEMKIWKISESFRIPPKETTYMCKIHRAPKAYNNKLHIVGFNTILPSEIEKKHIHRFFLHRCYPPEGQDPTVIFQKLVGSRAEECYVLSQPSVNQRIPNYCSEVKHVWGVGQKSFFLPDHLGMPLSESPSEYYMFRIHFDNPELLDGIDVKYSLEIFYTEKLRQHDVGVLAIGDFSPGAPSILVPPSSLAHAVFGHCGSACTQSIFPPEGILVFATSLQANLAGRSVRLLQIRNDTEMPMLSYDDNYNFNYQQIRVLREEKLIEPGDLLINRCVYENTGRNGSATVGGLSSRNERCSGYLWYYNKIPNVAHCRSEIRSDVYRSFTDIWNTTWSNTFNEMVVTSPSQFNGLPVSVVATKYTDWSSPRRRLLQRLHRYLPQVTQCPETVMRRKEVVDYSTSTTTTTPSPLQRFFDNLRKDKEDIVQQETLKKERIINDIRNPESEFISFYGRGIVPYVEPPNACYGGERRKRR